MGNASGFLHAALLTACLGLPAPFAQAEADKTPTDFPLGGRSPASVLPGERLSDWLLRQPTIDQKAPAPAYPPGLSWRVPAERQKQGQLKHHLLARLAAGAINTGAPDSAEVRQHLAEWIRTAPVTGRVRIASTDPRWLQAHPDQDPVLNYDHTVVLPQRPTSVTVITDQGQRCTLAHQPDAEAHAYLQACQGAAVEQIDRAWIVQPDGRVQNFGIALWNREAQDEPAPGAWIWAPGRNSGWSPQFSALLAEFLASQGPAPDLAQQTHAAATPAGLAPLKAATSFTPQPRSRSPMISANDWGIVGLLQTPTARMAETSELRFHFSHVSPYNRGSVLIQPLDWLEGGFRYTSISNRLYGPASLSGNQAYKDKSIDFKVRLMKETATLPQVAFGMTDIGGTGLFSSEYLVASKRTGDFDWSLGIGWGYLGGSNNLGNPLAIFGDGFKQRQVSSVSTGGTLNSRTFFHGNTALFGGVQYQTPWDNLLFKLEYDGNNYRHEPQDNNRRQSTPLNVGLVYRYSPAVDLTAGIERGDTLMLGFTMHGLLDQVSMPKMLDQAGTIVHPGRPEKEPDWSKTATDLGAQTLWSVQLISRKGSELHVMFDEVHGVYWNDRIDRIAAILHRDAPADISRFVLSFVEHGTPMSERIILREPWVAKRTRYQAMAEYFESVAAAEPRPRLDETTLWRNERGNSRLGLAPSFQQTLGGPDGFILFQAGISAPGEWRLTENTWLSGKANLRLVDNYSKFKYTAPSNMPRVRTYMREYLTSAPLTLPNLQVTHFDAFAGNQYYSAYAGYLESMFAGVGGEWLYRPWHSHYAFGIDINHVRQRDFHQNFSLRDYQADTGHASLYWDTGWKSTQIKLSAGKYLAGDRGITVEASKTFNNGVTIGAYATKTDASKLQFGEGSFDKGVYIGLPFEAMLPISSPTMAYFNWSPLTRDGGARLARTNTLYELTKARDKRRMSYAPAIPGMRRGLDDDTPEWAVERSIWDDLGKSTSTFSTQLVRGQTRDAVLLGGGIVLASALLDRPLANWADRHQTGNWNRLGKAATNLPLFLGAGTGMLWWGLGGEMASETAWTSLKSAGMTLGAETLMKMAVGRARPYQEQGAAHFTPFGKGSANGSMPSGHMGLAFALVTPFAQQYDAPWLYALAGATAFGRIQQRQHFASDVVAGSLIGYGIGSLLLDQQRNRRNMPTLSVGADQSIQAIWQME